MPSPDGNDPKPKAELAKHILLRSAAEKKIKWRAGLAPEIHSKFIIQNNSLEPIFNDYIKLEKQDVKGGWTFINMPVMANLPKKKNSTVRVRGSIDDYLLEDINIWAMKKGTFFAVKSDIRKAIKKEAGDTVRLILYLDEARMVIPEDFLICLKEEPKLYDHFNKFTEKHKMEITDWIFSAKTEDEKISRIGQTLEKLEIEMNSK